MIIAFCEVEIVEHASAIIIYYVSGLLCSVCSVYWCMGQGVLDRFSQVKPKVIFSVEAVRYNAKTHDHMAKLRSVVAGTERETVRGERVL